jgi:hypothetical protein
VNCIDYQMITKYLFDNFVFFLFKTIQKWCHKFVKKSLTNGELHPNLRQSSR